MADAHGYSWRSQLLPPFRAVAFTGLHNGSSDITNGDSSNSDDTRAPTVRAAEATVQRQFKPLFRAIRSRDTDIYAQVRVRKEAPGCRCYVGMSTTLQVCTFSVFDYLVAHSF